VRTVRIVTNDSIDRRFAEIVHDERKALKLSQGELARRMAGWGFPFYQQTIRRIEEGKRKVSIGEAVALTVALRLDINLSKLGQDLPRICPICNDNPPTQFTCNTCGKGS
jgi:transcriptional regulator with XRE-family HTH domain